MDLNFELLKQLCETPGIPGYETALRELVRTELAKRTDHVEVDSLGNVIGTRPSGQDGDGACRVMVAAHMDEIGFMVKHVDDKGFLRLQALGGFDPRVLMAQRVWIHTQKGSPLRGVLFAESKPIHLLDRSEIKPPKLDDLFVDTGLAAERVKELVEIGDPVTMDRMVERAGDCIVGKTLDDRVGVFVMLEALRQVQSTTAEIVAVATTQEEVGLRGAQTAAFRVEPDIAIALDVTIALDTPGGGGKDEVTKLGAGPAIKLMDSSSISHPALVRHFRDLAARHEIPYQLEILPRGGTDAGAMQRSRSGVPTITLSIPTRYVHTVNEMAHPRDITQAIELLTHYLADAHNGDYHL